MTKSTGQSDIYWLLLPTTPNFHDHCSSSSDSTWNPKWITLCMNMYHHTTHLLWKSHLAVTDRYRDPKNWDTQFGRTQLFVRALPGDVEMFSVILDGGPTELSQKLSYGAGCAEKMNPEFHHVFHNTKILTIEKCCVDFSATRSCTDVTLWRLPQLVKICQYPHLK